MPLCDRGRRALASVSELSLPPPLEAPPSLPISVPLAWAGQPGQGVGSEPEAFPAFPVSSEAAGTSTNTSSATHTHPSENAHAHTSATVQATRAHVTVCQIEQDTELI